MVQIYWTKYDNISVFLQDINNKRSIEEALAYEEQFFRDYHVRFCYFSSYIPFLVILYIVTWYFAFEGVPWFIWSLQNPPVGEEAKSGWCQNDG